MELDGIHGVIEGRIIVSIPYDKKSSVGLKSNVFTQSPWVLSIALPRCEYGQQGNPSTIKRERNGVDTTLKQKAV